VRIAVTGATGFLGRYIVNHLAARGHTCRCWYRPSSDRGGFEQADDKITWIEGELADEPATAVLVDGCDAVVHAALYRAGATFRGGEGDLVQFAEKNIVGMLRLTLAARRAGVGRFVFISTCAVHEKILDDRPLDEAHPLWSTHHYGAHKAAIEMFVHSFGLGEGYPICALRPTGIYGIARPVQQSKWYHLVRRVARGESVECRGGGKEVHAADVAGAVEILLSADGIAGQAYSCYDRYISEFEVATIAKQFSGSASTITGEPPKPKHEIVTEKIRKLGMQFGGRPLLERTVGEMIEALNHRVTDWH
jgi:nucleoside-diphosphate-sugar epimerase